MGYSESVGLTLPEKGNKKGEGKPMDVFRRVLDVQATYQLMGGEDPSPELQSALKRIVNDRIGDKGKALEVAEVAYQALFDDMGYIPAMSGERMRDRLTRIAEIQQNGGSVFVQDTESNKNNSPNEVKATQEPGTGQGGTLNGQGERFSDTGLNKRQDREVWHGRYESPVGSSDPYHGREGTVYVNDSSGSFYVMFDDGTYRNVFAIESTDGKYRCENSNGSTRNDQSNTESENTENTGGGGTVVGSNDDDDDDDDDDEGGEDGNESADTSATEPGNDEESNKEEDTEKEGTGTPDPEKNQGKRSSVFEKTEGRMGGQDHRNQEKVLEHQRSGKGTIDPNPDGGQTPGGVFKIEASAKEVEAKLLLIASKGTNSTPTFERGSSYGHTVEELKAIIVILGAAGAPTKPIVNPSTNPNSPVTGKQPPNGPAPKGEMLMQKESNGDDPEPGEGESPSNKPGAQGTNSPTNILNPPTPAPSAPVNKNLKDASKGSKNLKKTSVLKKK